jgi:predicted DNA binding CopG/RHH family protein
MTAGRLIEESRTRGGRSRLRRAGLISPGRDYQMRFEEIQGQVLMRGRKKGKILNPTADLPGPLEPGTILVYLNLFDVIPQQICWGLQMTEKTIPRVPEFATEAEEAAWWYENRQMVEDEFRKAIQDGTIRRGTADRLVREARESRNITIRIPMVDIERARELAEKKGIGYQTYMKMLLHEALELEMQRAG